MEKDRSFKVIAIVALVCGVVGLSLGFAAFSNTLNISSEAEVTVDPSTFSVNFSTESATTVSGNVTATGNGDAAALAGTTISGLKANFTAPGETVTYTFYARNDGEYIAYLKGITFANVTDSSLPRVCTAKTSSSTGTATTDALVQAACDDISVSISVGTDTNTQNLTSSLANITEHTLAKDASEVVTVKITYSSTGDRADGDFEVAFGDISLLYSSVD